GDGTRRGPPSSQVVRQFEIYCGFAVAPSDCIRLPERRVFEFSANGGFSVSTFVLEIGELISRFVLREIDRLVSRKARELVMNRETRLHFIVPLAIELALYIAGGFRLAAVDCFVDNAETDFRISGRRAILVSRHNCV